MRRMVLTLITILSACCLTACGGAQGKEGPNGSIQTGVESIVADEPTAKPVVIAEATAEPAPTEEPVVEATPEPTPEPTEEPVVYEGIDMESDLPGEDWIETFVGIIEEPKVIVFSDITKRKEIIEEKDVVKINPREDVIAIYLPDGYKYAKRTMGIFKKEAVIKEHSEIFFLDVEVTFEKKGQMAAIYVEHDGEEIPLKFTLVPVEE